MNFYKKAFAALSVAIQTHFEVRSRLVQPECLIVLLMVTQFNKPIFFMDLTK